MICTSYEIIISSTVIFTAGRFLFHENFYNVFHMYFELVGLG